MPADRQSTTPPDADGPGRGRRGPEDRLGVVLDALAEGVTFHDERGVIRFANPSALRILGLTLDQLCGRDSFDPRWRAVATDGAEFPAHLHPPQVVLRTGQPVNDVVFGVHRGDDTLIWVSSSAVPLRDENGRVTGVVCSFFDVTERLRIEASQREAEERFRATFEQAAVGIAHVGLDGRWLRVNPRFHEIVGYDRDELLARTFQDITHPDDLDADVAQVGRMIAGDIDRYSMEKRYIRRDGSHVWVNLTVALARDNANAPLYFISVVEDVTERRRAEEARRMVEYRFQRLVEHSPQSTQLFWPDGRTREVNRAFVRLFGITLDQLHDYNILEDAELERLGVLPLMKRAFAGEAVTIDPIPYVPDRGEYAGQVRWAGAYAYPVKDEAGRVEEVVLVHHDVTDRRRAEDELRRSRGQLASVIDNAPSAIFIKDLSGKYLLVNAPFERLAGAGPGSMTGKTDVDIFGAEVAGQFGEEDRRIAASSEAVTFEESFEYKGRAFTFMTTKFPLRDEAGRVYAVCGIATDVTALKQAEIAVRESEERLRLGLRAGRTGTWDWDVSADRVVWSEQIYEFHGLKPGEFGGTGEDFARLVHPEDRERVRSLLRQALEDGEPYEVEFRTVRPGGEVRWLSTTGQVVRDGEGKPVRMLGATIDVTDRRRAEAELRASEERFTAFMDNSPTASWITDTDGRVEYVSATYIRNFALPTADLIGKVPAEFYPREFADQYVSTIRAVAETGKAVEVEESAPRPDGTVGDFLVYKFPLKDKSGRPLVGGVAVDVTERKRADRAREMFLAAERTARAEAEQASRMKDEFLATLGHELRTPLNAILGWSHLLASGRNTPGELEEGLRVIERNARAQTQIIEDLLDMSRIISGKVRLDVRPLELGTVLRAAVDTVRHAADARGVRLEVDVDVHTGPVSGDPGRLHQVFWNLLSNAVKFTPRDGRVIVSLRREDAYLRAGVADTGEGIDPDFLPHVFNRFTQADSSTTRRHGGLGLGLAIVKQLVELHGGSVHAGSAGKNRGATFEVLLPLAGVNGEQPGGDLTRGAGGAQRPGPELWVDLNGVKVLVVDDEPDARELVRRLLEPCGAVVDLAGSAQDALARLAADRPDVLISDIGMPGVDGYTLMRQVRGLGPEHGGNTPAVAMTAYARAEDRVKAVTAGFQHHVAKPVEPAELIAMVASLVPRRRPAP